MLGTPNAYQAYWQFSLNYDHLAWQPVQGHKSVWWMTVRVDIDSLLSSISAFSMDLKEFKLHTDYSGISEQIKPVPPVSLAAVFNFESNF